jgi:hypothetical protein
MDLFFGAVFVILGACGLLSLLQAKDYRSGSVWQFKGWIICFVLSVFSLMALIVTLLICEQRIVKTYEVTDSFTNASGSVMKFNKPVFIKKRHTYYAWCAFRQERAFEVDTEGGCK